LELRGSALFGRRDRLTQLKKHRRQVLSSFPVTAASRLASIEACSRVRGEAGEAGANASHFFVGELPWVEARQDRGGEAPKDG